MTALILIAAATISWQLPSDPANVSGWRVYLGREQGSYFTNWTEAAPRTTLPASLPDGVYYASVAALDTNGVLGALSRPVEVIVADPTTELVFEWNPVAGVDLYRLYVYQGLTLIHLSQIRTTTEYTWSHRMDAGAAYSAVVKAVNSSGMESLGSNRVQWSMHRAPQLRIE